MNYGRCPTCGGLGNARERRPNGDTICVNGHKHSSVAFQRHAESSAKVRGEIEEELRCALRNAQRNDLDRCGAIPVWVIRWVLQTYFPKG